MCRMRGPVGLPLSSRRLFFPGGGRPPRSGLPPLVSGLSWVMGLSPPLSILLQIPRGVPARENESDKKKHRFFLNRDSKYVDTINAESIFPVSFKISAEKCTVYCCFLKKKNCTAPLFMDIIFHPFEMNCTFVTHFTGCSLQ